MHTPMKEMVKPIIATLDGFSLKMKLETNIEKIGVVLTRTVAFRMVVSLTADMKNMKCKPRKKLRIIKSFIFFRRMPWLNDFLRTSEIMASTRQAIIRRQKAMENASTLWRNLMKIAAVPKRMPAIIPSVRASFLVLIGI